MTTRTRAKPRGAAAPSSRAGTAQGGRFLTLFLAEEEYGIEILKVREILGVMPVTPVPRMPDFILGVINLRGKIIPVIDLRRKLSMPAVERTGQTCVVVVKANGLEVGVVVDKVSEVLDIAQKDIEGAPSFGGDAHTDYILGIGKTQSEVKLLLDIDRILSKQDMDYIGAARTADAAAPVAGDGKSHA